MIAKLNGDLARLLRTVKELHEYALKEICCILGIHSEYTG